MKRRLSLPAIAILVSAMFASTLAASPANKPSSSEADVAATLKRLYAAWSGLDPAKAAPFYAKDSNLTFFDVAPMKYNGWSEYADGVPKAFAPYRSAKFTLNDDLRVHQKGNLAWATATWHGDLSRKDGSLDHLDGRYTAVLEKRGNDWLVIHEHMSVPPAGEKK